MLFNRKRRRSIECSVTDLDTNNNNSVVCVSTPLKALATPNTAHTPMEIKFPLVSYIDKNYTIQQSQYIFNSISGQISFEQQQSIIAMLSNVDIIYSNLVQLNPKYNFEYIDELRSHYAIACIQQDKVCVILKKSLLASIQIVKQMITYENQKNYKITSIPNMVNLNNQNIRKAFTNNNELSKTPTKSITKSISKIVTTPQYSDSNSLSITGNTCYSKIEGDTPLIVIRKRLISKEKKKIILKLIDKKNHDLNSNDKDIIKKLKALNESFYKVEGLTSVDGDNISNYKNDIFHSNSINYRNISKILVELDRTVINDIGTKLDVNRYSVFTPKISVNKIDYNNCIMNEVSSIAICPTTASTQLQSIENNYLVNTDSMEYKNNSVASCSNFKQKYKKQTMAILENLNNVNNASSAITVYDQYNKGCKMLKMNSEFIEERRSSKELLTDETCDIILNKQKRGSLSGSAGLFGVKTMENPKYKSRTSLNSKIKNTKERNLMRTYTIAHPESVNDLDNNIKSNLEAINFANIYHSNNCSNNNYFVNSVNTPATHINEILNANIIENVENTSLRNCNTNTHIYNNNEKNFNGCENGTEDYKYKEFDKNENAVPMADVENKINCSKNEIFEVKNPHYLAINAENNVNNVPFQLNQSLMNVLAVESYLKDTTNISNNIITEYQSKLSSLQRQLYSNCTFEAFIKQNYGIEKIYEFQNELYVNTNNTADAKTLLLSEQTASGKSFIVRSLSTYYAISKKLLSIIILPTIALSIDQEKQYINGSSSINVAILNSSLSKQQINQVYMSIFNGYIDIILTTPEHVTNYTFINIVSSGLRQIALFCIDEAHCISLWSHSFRPAYQKLVTLIENSFPKSHIILLTATLTNSILNEIKSISKRKIVLINDSPIKLRDDLIINPIILKYYNNAQSFGSLCNVIDKLDKNDILVIYNWTKYMCNMLQKALQQKYRQLCIACYHSDILENEKKIIHEKLAKKKINIVIATQGFGLGIDCPNISITFHYVIPNNLEEFTQEIGRCNRNYRHKEQEKSKHNKKVNCSILLNSHDFVSKWQQTASLAIDEAQLYKFLSLLFCVNFTSYNNNQNMSEITTFDNNGALYVKINNQTKMLPIYRAINRKNLRYIAMTNTNIFISRCKLTKAMDIINCRNEDQLLNIIEIIKNNLDQTQDQNKCILNNKSIANFICGNRKNSIIDFANVVQTNNISIFVISDFKFRCYKTDITQLKFKPQSILNYMNKNYELTNKNGVYKFNWTKFLLNIYANNLETQEIDIKLIKELIESELNNNDEIIIENISKTKSIIMIGSIKRIDKLDINKLHNAILEQFNRFHKNALNQLSYLWNCLTSNDLTAIESYFNFTIKENEFLKIYGKYFITPNVFFNITDINTNEFERDIEKTTQLLLKKYNIDTFAARTCSIDKQSFCCITPTVIARVFCGINGGTFEYSYVSKISTYGKYKKYNYEDIKEQISKLVDA